MKTRVLIQATLVALSVIFLSCQDDDEVKPISTIDDIEVGLNDNEIGVIGRDFHFTASVLAGSLIDTVRIKIQPREGETYVSDWSYEIKWDDYKGVKNATWHKHFDIPEDAVEGTYDFIIIVEDENGTTLEEVRTITIYLAENLPVDPALGIFMVANTRVDPTRRIFYYGSDDGDGMLYMDETVSALAAISNVKGDGLMYTVLIKKSLDHQPETINDIDFSKAIVWDVTEHTGLEESQTFTNTTMETESYMPELTIGASTDNNLPSANPIDGEKAWETGDYYLGVLYENTTYNISFYYYTEVTLSE